MALLLLAALFWPVYKITSRSGPVTNPSPSGDAKRISAPAFLKATLSLQAAPMPSRFTVRQGTRILLSDTEAATAPGKCRGIVEMTPGEDLLVTAHWDDGAPHALRLEAIFEGNQLPLEKTFWAEESLEDALPIPQCSGQ